MRAIFFDRDGTINSDEGHYYIYKKEDFVFNPGVIDGIRRLNEAGYLIFVVTNQGGVAKGEYTIEDVEALHTYMCSELEKHGAHVDKIYYCPHHDSVAPCACGAVTLHDWASHSGIRHRQIRLFTDRRWKSGYRSRRGCRNQGNQD